MPIFVAAGAAAAYSYYKKRSSHLSEEEEGGEQAEAGEGASCNSDCKASANDPSSGDTCGDDDGKTRTNAGAGVPGKENDRPAPTLLEEWNKKYGANRDGRTRMLGTKTSSVEGKTELSRSTSVPVPAAENAATSTCTTGSDANKNVAVSRSSGPAEPIGVKDMETNNSADAAGDSTLLQTWNQRYPHLAKNKNRKQRRQRFDGPAGNMVRNFLAKRNADPRPTSTSAEDKYQQQPKVGTNTSRDEGVGSSEEEKEQKIDLCELEQNENASTDQGGKSEKDLSIEDDSFGTDALYKEVASAVFGGELSNR